MKINRISQALGSISDEFSREAIEEIEKTSNQNDSIIPDGKPRVVSEEKSRKTPIFIALAGLCAAAAIALPLVLKNVGRNSLLTSDNSSGVVASAPKVEKLGYDLDGLEDYREYKFEFTMPEYEGVAFECMHNKITANGEVIASGMPILQVYLADLNGDGRREIVSDTAYGSGILHKVISACDYSEKQLYMFSNRGLGWLDLFENNNELWLRETEYDGGKTLSEKKLELSDMKKIDDSTQTEENPYENLPFTEGRFVYGETEIPDFHVEGDEEGCIRSLENFSRGLESMVLETKTVGDYKVKLVGENVRTDLAYYPDKIFATNYLVEVEKDGKTLGSGRLPKSLLGLAQASHEFRFFKDKIGSYLDVYEMKQPVIAMKYYYDDASSVTDLSKIVTFAMISPEEQMMMLEGNFGRGIAASYNMSSPSDMKEIVTNAELFAENPDLDGTGQWLNAHSIFVADKFRIADYKTLVDDEAGIKFTFNFNVYLYHDKYAYTAEWDTLELTSKNMTVEVDRLKISHNDRELTADREYFSPNVSFLTVTLYPERCSKFAVVMDEYGNFELFEGDRVSKNNDRSDTSFLENLPENKFGYMWEFIDGSWQKSYTENCDKLHNCKHLFDETDGEEVYQLWISNNTDEIRDVCIDFYYNNIDGCTIDIIDNYNGTFSVESYGSSISSPCTIIFPKNTEIPLETVINSLIEKTSLSADEAKEYVQNYALSDLDFDGEAEVLVVNTFGSPAVHVFERKGTTYEESSVFPMKALEYTGYKLELNPYQNGDERYHYFRFHYGGGTMEADVLGAIKQTRSGYEAEYLYSWGTLDYKDIAEPVRKEFYRKGWDKYDIALTDSNPNDIPKEELAGILKNYGITLD